MSEWHLSTTFCWMELEARLTDWLSHFLFLCLAVGKGRTRNTTRLRASIAHSVGQSEYI